MKEYKTEAEFLKDYNPNDYDRLSMTADILLLSVSSKPQNNYRRLSEKSYSVLLIKRNEYPFKDKWTLPGGFLKLDETLDEAAKRILKTETNLEDIYMEQLYTFSDVKRDPRMRIVSTSYIALVDKNRLKETLKEEASWFDITFMETKEGYNVFLDNGNTKLSFKIKKTLKEKTTDRYSFKVIENKSIAFDHPIVIVSGMERLKNKVEYTDIVFNMMPEYFTLGELQQVYEVILGKELLDPAFRRIIQNKVEKTEKLKTGGGHRPSILYRYKK